MQDIQLKAYDLGATLSVKEAKFILKNRVNALTARRNWSQLFHCAM